MQDASIQKASELPQGVKTLAFTWNPGAMCVPDKQTNNRDVAVAGVELTLKEPSDIRAGSGAGRVRRPTFPFKSSDLALFHGAVCTA